MGLHYTAPFACVLKILCICPEHCLAIEGMKPLKTAIAQVVWVIMEVRVACNVRPGGGLRSRGFRNAVALGLGFRVREYRALGFFEVEACEVRSDRP